MGILKNVLLVGAGAAGLTWLASRKSPEYSAEVEGVTTPHAGEELVGELTLVPNWDAEDKGGEERGEVKDGYLILFGRDVVGTLYRYKYDVDAWRASRHTRRGTLTGPVFRGPGSQREALDWAREAHEGE